jgi:hypothetical protein
VFTLGRSVGTPKSVLLATRVTPRINEMVNHMANREGLYVSEWIRKIITNELAKNGVLGNRFYVPSGEQNSTKDKYSHPRRRNEF